MAKVSSNLLQAIWNALNSSIPIPRAYSIRRILQLVIDDGWMFSYQLEDLFYESDTRLVGYHHGIDTDALVEALGYHWTFVYDRPLARSNSAMSSRCLSSSDATAFLLDLEKLGFVIDPTFVVDRLYPAIAKKRRITDSELGILWSTKTREKSRITLDTEEPWNPGSVKHGKFENGYRYDAVLNADGSVNSLSVSGPKYRHRRDPVKTACPECGVTWWRGDPDSSASHRTEHRKRMHVLNPQPLTAMIAARMSESDPELVTMRSPAWKHFEIYRRALAFKREGGFDFVQWDGPEGDDDPHVHGFLMTNIDNVIVGAIAFRRREPEDGSPFWGLQWVWICPSARRSGILSSRWPTFRERFGDFHVEGPVSKSMQSFLAKHGDTRLMKWPTRRDGGLENDAPVFDD